MVLEMFTWLILIIIVFKCFPVLACFSQSGVALVLATDNLVLHLVSQLIMQETYTSQMQPTIGSKNLLVQGYLLQSGVALARVVDNLIVLQV